MANAQIGLCMNIALKRRKCPVFRYQLLLLPLFLIMSCLLVVHLQLLPNLFFVSFFGEEGHQSQWCDDFGGDNNSCVLL